MDTEPLSYESFSRTAPAVRDGLLSIGKSIDESGQDKALTELIKLRASQINGCAFCIQYHLNAGRKLGIATAKLDLLPGWRDAGIYTTREQAALAWTEALTKPGDSNAQQAARQGLEPHFTSQEIVFLTATIGLINAWNRIGAGLHFAPPIPAADHPRD